MSHPLVVTATGRIRQLKIGDTIEVPGAFIDGRSGTEVLRISGKIRIDHGIYIADAGYEPSRDDCEYCGVDVRHSRPGCREGCGRA